MGRPLHDWQRETRAAVLGSADGPIVVTGHQASFWHPGIWARYEAAEAFAVHSRAAALVELIVDQDTNDPLTFTMPGIVGNTLDAKGFSFQAEGAATASGSDVPVGLRPAVRVEIPGELDALPAIAHAGTTLEAMRHELNRHANEQNLALQVTKTHAALRHVGYGRQLNSNLHRILLPLSTLMRLPIWDALIQSIAKDPESLHTAYNASVKRFPSAGMAELGINAQDGLEMPLWIVDRHTGQRRRAWTDDLSAVGPDQFLPRAILTTAVVRLVLADVMVHGLGGSQYEQVTDALIRAWLGVEPAPYTTVSATVIPGLPANHHTMDSYHRLKQRSRWLRYNLHRVGWADDEFTHRYEQLLNTLRSKPRGSQERQQAFLALRQLQRDGASRYADHIQQQDQQVDLAARHLASDAFVNLRTAPFMMYGPADLSDLRARIWGAFSLSPSERPSPNCSSDTPEVCLCRPDSIEESACRD